MSECDHMNAINKAARRPCFMSKANHIDREGLSKMEKFLEFEYAIANGELRKASGGAGSDQRLF